MLKKILTTATIVLGMTAVAEASPIKIGVLTCDVDGGWSQIVGSSKNATCVFRDGSKHVHAYQAHLSKVGLDVGYVNSKTITWAVLSVNGKRSSLRGVYTGANAEVSALVGGGVNVLVGNTDGSFVLQPLSGQLQTGVNAALTVKSLIIK